MLLSKPLSFCGVGFQLPVCPRDEAGEGDPSGNMLRLLTALSGCTGAVGHTGWCVPHLCALGSSHPGADSQCQAQEVPQLKISRTQWGADRQAEEETDVESMWCEDCV